MRRVFPSTVFAVLALVAIPSASAQVGNNAHEARSRPSDSTETNAATTLSGNTTEAQKYYHAGLNLYDSGKTEEAIESLKRANQLVPRDAQTLYILGVAYSKSKAYKDAADSFKRATLIRRDWPEAQFRLGMMSYVLGRKSQSLEAYNQLLKLNSPLANRLYSIIKEDGTSTTNTETVVADNEVSSLKKADMASPSTSVQGASTAAGEESTPGSKENPQNKTVGAASATASGLSTASTPPDDSTLSNIYRVGVGDVLDVRLLYSSTPRSTLYTVIDGGFIDYPIAGGPVAVSGLTTDEIQNQIALELKRRAVEEGSRVSVGVRQYASHSVVITGLVNNPGTKFLRREAVPLYVILAEAQTRLDAGRVSIIRGGTNETHSLNITDPGLLNFLVRPGDMLSVTAKPQDFYYIAGRINFPGQKTFQAGITLLQAILAAGGPVRQGDNKVELSREAADGRLTTTTFKIKEIKSGTVQDPKLKPGDRIEVIR
jgi:protein involved in polysaccharide export with SLBB domain